MFEFGAGFGAGDDKQVKERLLQMSHGLGEMKDFLSADVCSSTQCHLNFNPWDWAAVDPTHGAGREAESVWLLRMLSGKKYHCLGFLEKPPGGRGSCLLRVMAHVARRGDGFGFPRTATSSEPSPPILSSLFSPPSIKPRRP